MKFEKDEKQVHDKEMQVQFEQIDKLDCFKFLEDIDPEACGYKFLNAMNLFRYRYMVSIIL